MNWKIVLLVVCLVVACFFVAYALGNSVGRMSYFQLMDFSEITKLEAFAESVSAKLRIASIKHFISCGNLIGIARYNTFVSWDDDIDFSIHEDDVPKLKTLFPQSTKVDYGYKISDPAYHPFIVDIFVYRKGCDGKLRYDSHKDRNKEYILEAEWSDPNSVATVEFGISGGPRRQIDALVGKVRENYLKRAYGENWKTQASVNKPHSESVLRWVCRCCF